MILVDNEKTQGQKLREAFMESIDATTLLDYKKKASDILDELVKQCEQNISKGKPPIATKDTVQSTTGIIAPNKELEDLFQDFKFATIMGDMAKERDLKIDFQARPMGIDQKTHQPVMGLVLVCTFI